MFDQRNCKAPVPPVAVRLSAPVDAPAHEGFVGCTAETMAGESVSVPDRLAEQPLASVTV